jgi:tRNA1Val (adenine37-N6)-methyltransferase
MHDSTGLMTTHISQPRRGYRFSADAVALAGFAQASSSHTVLDLCSGCGVVPILMWQHSPFCYGVGVELDGELVSLARKNVAQFHLEGRIHILQADIRLLSLRDFENASAVASPGSFDRITANPPYWPAGRGRLNPDLQKAAARHEISLTLAEVVTAARRFLKPGGRFYLSHLESRHCEIIEQFARNNLLISRTHRVPGLTDRLLFEARLGSPPSQ